MKELLQPTAAFDKQHSSAVIGRARAMEGTTNKATAALEKGSVTLECFGLSKVRFAGCLSVSGQRAQAPKGTPSGCWTIRHSGFLERKNQTNKFLGCVRDSHIIMFPFSTFFGKVCSKNRIPVTDESGSIKQCIS